MEIREALESAYDAKAGAAETSEEPNPVSSMDGDSGGVPGAVEDAGGREDAEAGRAGIPATTNGRARDDSGRFAKGAKAEATQTPKPIATTPPDTTQPPKEGAATVTEPPAPGVTTPTPAPEMKAPQSWKPTAREHFAKLPAEVQKEVTRIEYETRAALKEASESKKFHQSFQQTIAPFMGMIQAEGGEPLRAVQGLMQTAAALRTAPAQHKAKMVADIVRTFGIPVEMLAQALDGPASNGAAQPSQGQPPAYQDPRVDQLIAHIQQTNQQRQVSEAKRNQTEVEKFASANEFFEDVREDMADLIDIAKGRGVELSLDDAYARAVRANPETWKAMQQREQAKAAENANASTQRAKAASVSVKSQPAGVAAPQPKDTRSLMGDIAARLEAGKR